MEIKNLNEREIAEAARIRPEIKPSLFKLFAYVYLRSKYEMVFNHGILDFATFEYKDLHLYIVAGRRNTLSSRKIEFIKEALREGRAKVFVISPLALPNVKEELDTPIGPLFVAEITSENIRDLEKVLGDNK